MNVFNQASYSSLPYVSDCYPLGCNYTAKKEEGKKGKLPVPKCTCKERHEAGNGSFRLSVTAFEEKYY